ncbi:hypothetical protein C8C83_5520 [Flavobacterium sp. 90]|uniref:hypothetical protein n=1 Tax=unclassified Flavobacterium TaxID=196869 RepID=UPI000EAD15DB|nr:MULTISPECIES: hypothetical protein [unclassified Flavobacterium]RKR08283.1 hypothetical protein C8C82_0150 [Flavobacterium sp. 81]TCK57471.1 hypothetical protein C8C83_5520 [Flavobacterium sp. 90]
MKTTSILILFLFIIISCAPKDTPTCHYKIKIKNNTNKILFIGKPSDNSISILDIREHPIEESVKAFAGNNGNEIGSIHFIGSGKPMCVENILSKKDTMRIFLCDSVAIANKKWNEVREKHLVAKSYKITLEELQKTNFTIEYNGK